MTLTIILLVCTLAICTATLIFSIIASFKADNAWGWSQENNDILEKLKEESGSDFQKELFKKKLLELRQQMDINHAILEEKTNSNFLSIKQYQTTTLINQIVILESIKVILEELNVKNKANDSLNIKLLKDAIPHIEEISKELFDYFTNLFNPQKKEEGTNKEDIAKINLEKKKDKK